MSKKTKNENLESAEGEPKGDAKIDPIQLLIKEIQDMKSYQEKLNQKVDILSGRIADTAQNSPKKESPLSGSAPNVLVTTPIMDKTQVILSAAPPQFMKVLKDLQSPYEFWVFTKAYKDYKLKYAGVAQHMRIVQHIDQDILNGPLNLAEEIDAATGTLLSDARIFRAAEAYFQLTVTTEKQFLDLIQKITFEPAPYDKRSNNAMLASQPLFVYLSNVAQFYGLLREMLPGAVPREDEYDRNMRTTVKHVVNAHLTKWWPWWSTNIWPTFGKSKERYWTELSTGILEKCRAVVAAFYPVQPLLETLTAFNAVTIMAKPADSKPATRPLWQPFGKRDSLAGRVQPPAAKVHMLEESAIENDFNVQYEAMMSGDLIPPDNEDMEEPELNAIGNEATERNLCFTKLIKGICTKTDCVHRHDKAAMDAMAKTILGRPT